MITAQCVNPLVVQNGAAALPNPSWACKHVQYMYIGRGSLGAARMPGLAMHHGMAS